MIIYVIICLLVLYVCFFDFCLLLLFFYYSHFNVIYKQYER